MTFSAEVKNSSKCDYSLSWAASTSRVLFPVWNATRKAKGVTHSPAAGAVFGRSRSWNNQRGELRSLMNLWMGWRRLHKREKGSLLWTLSAGEKWSSSSLKGPFWPCLIILLLVYAFHTKTLYPPMHTVEPLQWASQGTLSQHLFTWNGTIPPNSYWKQPPLEKKWNVLASLRDSFLPPTR